MFDFVKTNNPTQPPGANETVWRWIFLCSLASLATLTAINIIEFFRGRPFLDYIGHPIGTMVAGWTLGLTDLFLLFFSPLFFRRLGHIAIWGWIIALTCLLFFLATPTY